MTTNDDQTSTLSVGEINEGLAKGETKLFDEDNEGYQIFASPDINPLFSPLVEEFLALHAADRAEGPTVKVPFSFVVSDSNHHYGRKIDDVIGAAAVDGDTALRFTEKRVGSEKQVAVRVVSDGLMERIVDQMGGAGVGKAVSDYLKGERPPTAVLTIVAWHKIYVQIFEQITPDKQHLATGGEIMIPLNPAAKA